MNEFSNIENAFEYYVVSNKLKSDKNLNTYQLIRKKLCDISHTEKTVMPITKFYSFSK
jgi:hypothetical protein